MDRRRAKRFNVVELELFYHDDREHIGQVINISKGGILVNSKQEYTAGEKHSFYIPFTQAINGEVEFKFTATIIWCQQNPLSTSSFSIGMEFSDFAELQTVFIQQMIKIYGEQ